MRIRIGKVALIASELGMIMFHCPMTMPCAVHPMLMTSVACQATRESPSVLRVRINRNA